MFIYCGISDNRPRVLDTDDGVVESIDALQFKVLQSKGYEIIKDFSYDYAYKFYNFLQPMLTSCSLWEYLSYRGNIKDEYYKIMDALYDINDKFDLGINRGIIIRNRISAVALCKNIGVVGIYITESSNKYDVYALVAGINGVFFKHLGLRLKGLLSSNQDIDLFVYKSDFVIFVLYLEDSMDLLQIQIDKFGNIGRLGA